jgi:hypothetical protein
VATDLMPIAATRPGRFTVPPGGFALWLRLTGTRSDIVVAVPAVRARGLSGTFIRRRRDVRYRLRLPFTPPIATLDRVAAMLDRACGDQDSPA